MLDGHYIQKRFLAGNYCISVYKALHTTCGTIHSVEICVPIGHYLFVIHRLRDELVYHSNQIPFFSEQLVLLTNVKRMTHEFDLTINILLTNAKNLMKSIIQSLHAIESILIKVNLSQ